MLAGDFGVYGTEAGAAPGAALADYQRTCTWSEWMREGIDTNHRYVTMKNGTVMPYTVTK